MKRAGRLTLCFAAAFTAACVTSGEGGTPRDVLQDEQAENDDESPLEDDQAPLPDEQAPCTSEEPGSCGEPSTPPEDSSLLGLCLAYCERTAELECSAERGDCSLACRDEVFEDVPCKDQSIVFLACATTRAQFSCGTDQQGEPRIFIEGCQTEFLAYAECLQELEEPGDGGI
jgi:hypothetical protein